MIRICHRHLKATTLTEIGSATGPQRHLKKLQVRPALVLMGTQTPIWSSFFNRLDFIKTLNERFSASIQPDLFAEQKMPKLLTRRHFSRKP